MKAEVEVEAETAVEAGAAQAGAPAAELGPAAAAKSYGDVLDVVTWASLTGRHAAFARRNGHAVSYTADVGPFAAVADPDDPGAWADLAALVGPGAVCAVPGQSTVPDGWDTVRVLEGVQLVGTALLAEPDPEAVVLGPADVPEMLELVALTQPGPFAARTVELGTYLGIRHEGALVAMAGERMQPPGWSEISAVCTHPDFRGRGLAARLVRAVAAGIRARGDQPFLHAAAQNTNAVRLYLAMGFEVRRRYDFAVMQAR